MRLSQSLSLMTATLLCAFSTPALPSGNDGLWNRFANPYAPQQLHLYAAGKLGVIPGTYWRINHYLAYQAAKGKPLTRAQLTALSLMEWRVRGEIEWDAIEDEKKNGTGAWFDARAEFAQQWELDAENDINVMGTNTGGSYLNCHADAFRKATETLKARAKLGAGGKSDVWHKQWLIGQDQVFSNCGGANYELGKLIAKPKVALPPPLPKGAPDWLKFDHAYQNAAANFYGGDFDQARTQFQAIALQAKSPWQPLGAYLAARCLVRKATLWYPLEDKQPPAPARLALLAQAKTELDAQATSYAPSIRIASYVDARLNPKERIAALARLLDQQPFNADTPRLLADYLILLDTQPQLLTITAKEPLTAWIGAMQAGVDASPEGEESNIAAQRPAAIDGMRKVWLKQGDPIWFAPLLSLAKAGELTAAEKKAAAAVPASHPLYQTVQYHLARIAIAEKEQASADKSLDKLLATSGKSMSVATSNRFLALKMLSAGTLDGYMKAAVRPHEDFRDAEPIVAEGSDAAPDVEKEPPELDTDDDFGRTALRMMPLGELKKLIKHPQLPAAWKARLQDAIFTRALILKDEDTALEYLDAVAKSRPADARLYARYRTANGAERQLAAMLILVNTPELEPYVVKENGVARFWGCNKSRQFDYADGAENWQAPYFLKPERLAEAEKEQQVLMRLPLRSEYLAPTLLEWAVKNASDQEAPKALHMLVNATRYECPNHADKPEKEQLRARYSRQAYDLLHKQYGESKWAKATKYFY